LSRKKTLHRIFDSVRPRLPAGYTFAAFEAAFQGWDVVPLTRNDELIGGVLIQGHELHVGYVRAPGSAMRRHLREVMERMPRPLKTAVAVDNAAGLRFCQRLGFQEIGRADGVIHLRCEKPNYV